MGKKTTTRAAKKTAATEFETDIIPGVPNEDVPGMVAEIMRDPNYVRHNLLPDGPSTTTIIVIYRK